MTKLLLLCIILQFMIIIENNKISNYYIKMM